MAGQDRRIKKRKRSTELIMTTALCLPVDLSGAGWALASWNKCVLGGPQ